MKTKTLSPEMLRKRTFLMVLPLLVLPFVTLLFWSLGGGNTNEVQSQHTSAKLGLNLELPDAILKDDKRLDKLSYYEKAASDSAKIEELIKNDPYYLQTRNREGNGTYMADSMPASIKHHPKYAYRSSNLNTSPYGNHYQDPNEAKVYSKLQELDKAMNQASVKSEAKSETFLTKRRDGSSSINSSDIDRLEQMMAITKQEDAGGGDSEMHQLNAMMERILDIQHPERVKERIQQTSETHKGQQFAVNVNSNIDSTSLLKSNTSVTQARFSSPRFYSLDEDVDTNLTVENAIKAAVYETQMLVDGSVVKLRLLNNVFINGNLIPKDHFVFGIASLIGERLIIKINSIRYNNSLYPVDLSVSDMDGIDGIYIPGAITRDVAKQSADRAIQGIGLSTIDPSLKVQAATAGIEAAKTLFSRKAKLIKVKVKAGYQVLLKDQQQKTSF